MHQQLLASSRLPPVSASVAVGQIPNAKRSFSIARTTVFHPPVPGALCSDFKKQSPPSTIL
jgi:hypothetical protein